MRLSTFRRLLPTVFAAGLLIALTDAAHAAAPAITSFSPAGGTIGTSVSIAGSGFTGATAVGFDGAAAAFKVMSNNKIIATAPNTVATGKITVKSLKGTATGRTNFVAAPGADLSPASGAPLALLTVAGAGFRPSAAVDMYFDQTEQALAVTSARGTISMQMQVPASAQPGTHWVSLVARGTNVAAQAQFRVGANWPMAGISAQGRNNNTAENTITNANVNRLTDKWTKFTGGFANASPFVEFGGNLYTGDVRGAIRVYSSTGATLWTAATGSDLENVTPAAYGNLVFFGAANGNVYAYNVACRRDGGVCVPKWTKSVGTAVTGSLRTYGNKLYAPSADGSVHVLNPLNGTAGTPVSGFSTSAGSVTTPITFGADGTLYYGAGATLEYRTPDGSSGASTKGGTVSPVVAANGAAYYTTGDGKINEFGGAGWSAATSGTGCAPAPAVANDLVYAGGCTTLTAFEAGRGTPRWSVTTPGAVIGISVANGVAYACVDPGSGFGGLMTAYDASFGGLLWSGGRCTGGAPIIANGAVYAAFANITAYGLPGAQPNAIPARPTPRTLRPDYTLLPGKARLVPAVEAR